MGPFVLCCDEGGRHPFTCALFHGGTHRQQLDQDLEEESWPKKLRQGEPLFTTVFWHHPKGGWPWDFWSNSSEVVWQVFFLFLRTALSEKQGGCEFTIFHKGFCSENSRPVLDRKLRRKFDKLHSVFPLTFKTSRICSTKTDQRSCK